MMPIGWAIIMAMMAALVAVAVMEVRYVKAKEHKTGEAFDLGYDQGRESVHDEYEKRRVMTDKLYRRVMRIYNGEIERSRLEVRHLRMMAGLEQEGVE